MDTSDPLSNPLYKNWVRATVGFLCGKRAIIPIIQKAVNKFKTNIIQGKPTCSQCTIVNFRLPTCPKDVCTHIYDKIKEDHVFNKPMWDNADTSQWCFNSWEMAKCYMPKSKDMKDVKSIEETDFAGIVNLVIHSKYVQAELIGTKTNEVYKKVRDIRNQILHSGNFEVSNDDVANCLDKLQEMIVHTAPSEGDMKIIYNKIEQLKNEEFHITITDEYNALKEEATNTRLESDVIIQMLKERIFELEEQLKTDIPQNIKKQHNLTVQQWKKEDSMFVEIGASRAVMTATESNDCILVTGIAGSGKSALLHHEALRLQRQCGFQILPVTKPEQILNYHNIDQNQVFILDDCVGESFMNNDLCDNWRMSISSMVPLLNSHDKLDSKMTICTTAKTHGNEEEMPTVKSTESKRTIILLSSRLNIYKESHYGVQFDRLQLEQIDLTTMKMRPSDDDIEGMVLMYIPKHSDIIKSIKFSDITLQCVPLLSVLSIDRDQEFVIKLFEDHIKAIRDDLTKIKDNKVNQFLCICIVVLLQIVNCDLFVNKDNIPKHVSKLMEAFGINHSNECHLKQLINNFRCLEGSYLKIENNSWIMLHQTVFYISAKICGEYLFDFFLDNSTSSFVSSYYSFEFIEQSFAHTNGESIQVPMQKEYKYFDRLTNDILTGDLKSSFNNIQLSSTVYRNWFRNRLCSDYEVVEKIRRICSTKSIDFNPFHTPCRFGYNDIVQMLVDIKCSVNCCDEFGKSALHLSSLVRNVSATKTLLDNGADINARTKNGCTPLHFSCHMGHLDISKLLLDKGSDMTSSDKDGRIPLHQSCLQGHFDVSKLLLDKGSDLMAFDKGGWTPLHLSCYVGNVDLTYLLLDRGSDVSACDKSGWTCLHCSSFKGHVCVTKLLLDKGSDLTARDDEGSTPLHYSSKQGHTDITKLLLERGSDVNACDKCGSTSLHYSSSKGHVDVTNLLQDNGGDVNACGRKGTPLHVSCMNGHLDVTKLLLDKGSEVNACNEYGSTPLHFSCTNGHADVTKLLLSNIVNACSKFLTPLPFLCHMGHLDKGSGVNACDQDGSTPLHCSSKQGHTNIIRLLLDTGSDVNACDKGGSTPLHFSCNNGYVEATTLLLDNGSDINACDKSGSRPLHCSSIQGHFVVTKLLLDKKSDMNACDKDDATPLHLSCKEGHVDVSKLLLDRGSYTHTADREGRTPLHHSCIQGHVDITKLLLDKGSYMHTADQNGRTPLHHSCIQGYVDITKLLLDKGSDIDTCDNDGSTPLHWACRQGHVDVTELLIDEGSDVEAVDTKSLTPLHYSCVKGHFGVTKCLLDHGSDSNACENTGLTPLHLTCCMGHFDVIKLLLEKGSDANACDKDGLTPLHYSSVNGDFYVTKMLLDKGGDMNACDKNGLKPLHYSLKEGHLGVTTFLFKAYIQNFLLSILKKVLIVGSSATFNLGFGMLRLIANIWHFI